MRVIIYGIGGTMGKILFSAIKDTDDVECVAGVDKYLNDNSFGVPIFASAKDIDVQADCLIDFSVHQAVYDYLPYAVEHRLPCVIASTGINNEESAYIDEAAASIPVLQSGNMSLGINLLIDLVKKASHTLKGKSDIEIIEMHHNKKVDAPSGTAKMLADAVADESDELVYGREGIVGKRKPTEIGMHSVRGGTIVGKHQVMFIMNNEIVTLSHEAENKGIFAAGSINAARFLVGKPAGRYSMKDYFAE